MIPDHEKERAVDVDYRDDRPESFNNDHNGHGCRPGAFFIHFGKVSWMSSSKTAGSHQIDRYHFAVEILRVDM